MERLLITQEEVINSMLPVVNIGKGTEWDPKYDEFINYTYDFIKSLRREKITESSIFVDDREGVDTSLEKFTENVKNQGLLLKIYLDMNYPICKENYTIEEYARSIQFVNKIQEKLYNKNIYCGCGLGEVCHGTQLIKILHEIKYS